MPVLIQYKHETYSFERSNRTDVVYFQEANIKEYDIYSLPTPVLFALVDYLRMPEATETAMINLDVKETSS